MLLFPALSVLFNYLMIIIIQKNETNSKAEKTIMTFAIVVNVLSLAIFKYIPLNGILAPLGISFITFGQIAYLVDSYKGLTFNDSIDEYLLYILWFPKVSQGPLLKHDDFMISLRDSKRYYLDYDNLSQGIFFFAIGLFKKLYFADGIAHAVNYCYEVSDKLGTVSALIAILGYTLQIYMDFSAYSDMAIGISKMFNIELPINFNSPYKAVSVTDFWKRWHISLTDFLREYIYFPLGGSKKGQLRTCINIILVYSISGLWHGSGLSFLLWGLLHGLCQVIERVFKKTYNSIPVFIRRIMTFAIVNAGWVLFRCDSLKQFAQVMMALFKKDEYAVCYDSLSKTTILGLNDFFVRFGRIGQLVLDKSTLVILISGYLICFLAPNLYEKKKKYNVALAIVTVILLVFEILSLAGAKTTFIYFNF